MMCISKVWTFRSGTRVKSAGMAHAGAAVRCGAVAHLRLPLEGLLQLQVLSCLARQIHPFAFEPLDSRFAEKILGFHFGNEGDVSTFDTQC